MKNAVMTEAPDGKISWENILTSLEDGVILIDKTARLPL